MGLFSGVKKAVKKVASGVGKAVKSVAAPVAAIAGIDLLGGNASVQNVLSSLGIGGLLGDSNSGLLSLLSPMLNYEGTRKQIEAQNKAAQQQWQFAREQLANQNALARQNMEMQKVFAQNGIRWRVEDAKAAGLHPLIGAGSQSATYSPGASVGVGIPESGSSSIAGAQLQALGQGLERAMSANEVRQEREYQDRLRAYELMSRELQNEETVSRIGLNQARIKELQRTPAFIQRNVSKGIPLKYANGKQVIPGQADAVEAYVDAVMPTEKEASRWQNLWGLVDVPMVLYRSSKYLGTKAGNWAGKNYKGYNRKYGHRSVSTGDSWLDSFTDALGRW